MSILQLFSDVGDAFNRVIQRLQEKMFDAERTEYDDEYAGNVKKMNTLLDFTDFLIDDLESMLEPNPAYRLEGRIMDKVDKKSDRSTPLEDLGVAFDNASHDVKQYNYELYKDFLLCSKYQTKLGVASKEFQNLATDIYVSKLKKLLNHDLKKFQEEDEILESLRLDYDSLRIRIKNAITVAGKEALEREFDGVKEAFYAKLRSNMSYFKGVDQLFDTHRDLLKEFIELQSKYYQDCHHDLEKFKSKMESRSYYSYTEKKSEVYEDGVRSRSTNIDSNSRRVKENQYSGIMSEQYSVERADNGFPQSGKSNGNIPIKEKPGVTFVDQLNAHRKLPNPHDQDDFLSFSKDEKKIESDRLKDPEVIMEKLDVGNENLKNKEHIKDLEKEDFMNDISEKSDESVKREETDILNKENIDIEVKGERKVIDEEDDEVVNTPTSKDIYEGVDEDKEKLK